MSGYPLRVWLVLAIGLLVPLPAAILYYQQIDEISRSTPDRFKMEEQSRRLAGVIQDLPPDAIVGYLSDVPFSQPEGQAYFFGVQYWIAPRLLVEETSRTRRRWVIGSFLRRPDIQSIESEHGLKLVKSYGMGVYLFQREP